MGSFLFLIYYKYYYFIKFNVVCAFKRLFMCLNDYFSTGLSIPIISSPIRVRHSMYLNNLNEYSFKRDSKQR